MTRGSGETHDPLRLLVFHHLFAACAEEMGESLMRAAFSPNIRERRDFSCALFDGAGGAVAQAAHLPVHLGSAPLSLAAVLEDLDLEPGDVAMVNDPYRGGTHLPDLTVVEPVWLTPGGAPDFWCLARAHHADMGGAHPGSMAPARDVHGEGLRLPPVRLVRAGELDEDLLRVFLANTRVPRERRADLQAQLAACRSGAHRLRALADEYGPRTLAERAQDIVRWTEARTRAALAELPRGTVEVEDTLELASGGHAHLRLRWTHGRKESVFDFSATDDQLPDPVNTVHAVALSAVHYAIRLLLPEGTPTNAGIGRCVRVVTRAGSLLDASYPAPVAAGNVETSQRAVDLVLAALREVLPDRVPAASSGTMSNLTLGAADGSFSYYETLAGGAGGGPEGPGAHAVHTHMTNTLNTPVEVLERELPVRVLATTVRRGSGGAGAHPGGDGLLRRLQVLAPVRAGWSAQRQQQGPPGAAGGAAGAPGGASLRAAGARRARPLPGQAALDLQPGDELEVRTPGGGGHGRAPRAK